MYVLAIGSCGNVHENVTDIYLWLPSTIATGQILYR